MNLAGNQIKDSYGNLVTIGTVAGTPTTGTLQNGAGSDLTSITLNGAAVFNEGGADFDFRVEGLNDANLLFVDASADRIGIGTNSPANTIHVIGGLQSSIRIDGTQGTGATHLIETGGGNADVLSIRAQGQLNLTTNSGDRLRIDSSGNVGIGTTTPAAKLHVVGGNIKVGDTYGIDFSDTAGTGTSELLDDYEEGTWTPTYEAATPFTSITYDAITNGRYVKIGSLVHCYFIIRTDAISGGSGDVSVGGLPFTSITAVNFSNPGGYVTSTIDSAGYQWAGDVPSTILVNSNSNSALLLYFAAAGGYLTKIDVSDLGTGANNNFMEGVIIYRTA